MDRREPAPRGTSRYAVLFFVGFLLALTTIFLGCRGSVDRVYDDALGSSGGIDGGGKGNEGDGNTVAPSTAPAKIGGTVVGLLGAGLVLQNNGGDDLTVLSGGAFAFTTLIPPGQPYNVTVRAQPSGPTQTCTVSNGAGTAAGVDVLNISVTCVTQAYPIGGSVVGLVGAGLVLQNNGGNDLPVSADGAFTFTQPVPSGASFNVSVKTQPSGPAQTCSVSGATGTVVTAPVSSVVVNCGTNTFTVGGTVTGLAGTLVIQNNAGDDRMVTANGSFAFATPILGGATYNVTVKTQPLYPPVAQTCTIANGSGTIGAANVGNVAITCTTAAFTLGGNVSGLTSAGLVLQNNGGSNKTITASGAFSFGAPVLSGSPYNVTILTQPGNDKCVVTGGTGTVTNANINTINVSCTPLIVLTEEFDGVAAPGLPAGWSTAVIGVPGDPSWITETSPVNTAPNSAHAADIGHVSELTLDSPAINIATSSAQLTFWNHYETETPWDGAVLEISIAGGAFQDIIAAGGAFVAGGYNQTLNSGAGNPVGGRNSWAGSNQTQTIVNLPASAAGKSIVLRWRMGSDDGADAPGWNIDSIQVKN